MFQKLRNLSPLKKLIGVVAALSVIIACGTMSCEDCEAALKQKEADCQQDTISGSNDNTYKGQCTPLTPGEADAEGNTFHMGGCVMVTSTCFKPNGSEPMPQPQPKVTTPG